MADSSALRFSGGNRFRSSRRAIYMHLGTRSFFLSHRPFGPGRAEIDVVKASLVCDRAVRADAALLGLYALRTLPQEAIQPFGLLCGAFGVVGVGTDASPFMRAIRSDGPPGHRVQLPSFSKASMVLSVDKIVGVFNNEGCILILILGKHQTSRELYVRRHGDEAPLVNGPPSI